MLQLFFRRLIIITSYTGFSDPPELLSSPTGWSSPIWITISLTDYFVRQFVRYENLFAIRSSPMGILFDIIMWLSLKKFNRCSDRSMQVKLPATINLQIIWPEPSGNALPGSNIKVLNIFLHFKHLGCSDIIAWSLLPVILHGLLIKQQFWDTIYYWLNENSRAQLGNFLRGGGAGIFT